MALGELFGSEIAAVFGQIFDDRELDSFADLWGSKANSRSVAESFMHEINKLLDVTAENFVPGEFAGRVAKNSFSDLHKFQAHKRKYIESIPFSGHGLYNWYMRLPMTPEGKKARIQLYKAINDVLKARDITQTEAAELLGIRQAKISAIKMMRLDEFATDRLVNFLNILGYDIEIVVKAKSGSKAGHLTVTRK